MDIKLSRVFILETPGRLKAFAFKIHSCVCILTLPASQSTHSLRQVYTITVLLPTKMVDGMNAVSTATVPSDAADLLLVLRDLQKKLNELESRYQTLASPIGSGHDVLASPGGAAENNVSSSIYTRGIDMS